MRFDEVMYWNFIFLKKYHSLDFNLRLKSYKLKIKVLNKCFWFEIKEF